METELAGAPISLAGELLSPCEANDCREQYMERILDWWAKVKDIRRLGTGTPLSLPAPMDWAFIMPGRPVGTPRCPKAAKFVQI